jgi:hypothetical protein
VCDKCSLQESTQTLSPLDCPLPRPSGDDLKRWFEALRCRSLFDPLQSELNLLVRQGVPEGLRATVWPVLLCVSEYEASISVAASSPLVQSAVALELLEHDLPRTFPEHTPTSLPQFQQTLRQTLLSLRVPYQQGLSLIVAFILRHVAPKDVVLSLHALLEQPRYGLLHVFGSVSGIQEYPEWIHGFQVVFEKLLPSVAKALAARQVDVSVVVCKWLRTAFAGILPEPVLVRVWDLYFLHGFDFLFRVAVSLFVLVQSEIDLRVSVSELLRVLTDLPARAMARLDGPNQLIELSLSLR